MAGLLDFLQAASNSAASNVSGPVDGLAWLLRKAGIPIPEDAVGGSQWMEKQGLTRPVQQGLLSTAGETAGLLAPIAAAAKAPQIARGLLQMGENAAAPSLMAQQVGAVDMKAITDALEARRSLLGKEADDWAARKYKKNDKVVEFAGDGPVEGMRIGAINEKRRRNNITGRNAQIDEITAALETLGRDPGRLERAYEQALNTAKHTAQLNREADYTPHLERYLEKSFTGNPYAGGGPSSLGGILRREIERQNATVKPVAAAQTGKPPPEDWMLELFGMK